MTIRWLAPTQLTREQALAFHDSCLWKYWDDVIIFAFQLGQQRLCVPFDRFYQAAESALARPVWTYEFADLGRLQQELMGKQPKAVFADVALFAEELVGADKVVVLYTEGEEQPCGRV